MSQTIVEVRDLSFRFPGKKVLGGLNFSLAPGEWAVLAGRNGVGKSTLLRLLAGVLLPDAGTVERAAGIRPERVGFISDRLSLFEDWTIGRAVDFHCRVFGVEAFDDGLVRRLGVGAATRIRSLSAGERAILHLSLVLAQRPALLLVDEVLHMLDPYIRDLFIGALIEALAPSSGTSGAAQGAAVLTVNHTFGEIERIPERVLVMDEGRFVVDEATEALRARMKKVVGRDPLPAGIPCVFRREEGEYREYFIYPCDGSPAARGLELQDVTLAEIIKAFIGGGYDKKRMA